MPRKLSKALGARRRDENLLGGYEQCPVGMGSRSCHREACSWSPEHLAPWRLTRAFSSQPVVSEAQRSGLCPPRVQGTGWGSKAVREIQTVVRTGTPCQWWVRLPRGDTPAMQKNLS